MGSPTSHCQQWNFVITNTQRVGVVWRFPRQMYNSFVIFSQCSSFRLVKLIKGLSLLFFPEHRINHSFFFRLCAFGLFTYFIVEWSLGSLCPREDWGMTDDFSLVPSHDPNIVFAWKFLSKFQINRVPFITRNW